MPRHDFYQTGEHVVLSVFVRGQKHEEVSVCVDGTTLTVSAPGLPEPWTLALWAQVVPPPRVHVVPSKIEITLTKAEHGAWPALTQGAPPPAPAPPSSRSKWDAITVDDAPPAGSGDAELNAFFQQLYANADADTRRAMIKSFQESGGTALSTNWADVKDKTMHVRAPDGMEARRYEQ